MAIFGKFWEESWKILPFLEIFVGKLIFYFENSNKIHYLCHQKVEPLTPENNDTARI